MKVSTWNLLWFYSCLLIVSPWRWFCPRNKRAPDEGKHGATRNGTTAKTRLPGNIGCIYICTSLQISKRPKGIENSFSSANNVAPADPRRGTVPPHSCTRFILICIYHFCIATITSPGTTLSSSGKKNSDIQASASFYLRYTVLSRTFSFESLPSFS